MTKKFRYLNASKEPRIPRPPRMPSEDQLREARAWLEGLVNGEPMGIEFLNTVCESIAYGYQYALRGDLSLAKDALTIAIAMARKMDRKLTEYKSKETENDVQT